MFRERKELGDAEKVELLSRLVTSIFGYNAKIDWKQEYYSKRKLTVRDVDLDDNINVLSKIGRAFDFSITARGEQAQLDDEKVHKYIYGEIDIELFENDYFDLLRRPSLEIKVLKRMLRSEHIENSCKTCRWYDAPRYRCVSANQDLDNCWEAREEK